MVSSGTVIAVGLLIGFTAVGGASLVKPAITNAKSAKNSVSTKIQDTRTKLKGSAKSG